jgi:phosphoglycolate phosphatase-like HAD superfamily hydrolase
MFWSGASAFDCDGSLIDWKSCIFSALHSLIAAHHKTLSDDALDELYAEQADLIFDRRRFAAAYTGAQKVVPEENV